MDLARTLSYNYVFRGVPRGTVAFLAALAEVRDFDGGAVLVRQFDTTRDILVILDGEAVTRTFGGDVVARFGPGSIIGEMSLLDGQARSATVTAIGKVTVAILKAQDVENAMESDPIVAKMILSNLSRVLCRRLRSMNAQIEAMPNRIMLV